MRKMKYFKSIRILVFLILVVFVLSSCNFLKAVLPDTNEEPATTNTESTTGSNEETATTSNSGNSGDNSDTGTSAPPDLGGITEYVKQEVLVKVMPGADVEEIISEVGGTIIETLPQISVIRIKLAPQVSVAEAIQILEKLEEVEYAEPNGICYMDLVPDDTDYASSQWAPQLTEAESAWDVTTGDPGITIAITDTGVDGTHPDLGEKVIAGYDTYNNTDILAGTDSSVHYHGTHCAGIAAAIGNNSEGIAGVAWDCPIMPIKICRDDYPYTASWSDMSEAFIWAADHGADIISCSFGGKGYSQTMKDAIDYAVIDIGCVMFVSMGNDGNNQINYPAGYQSVIAVGATDAHDEIASFSTTGNHISVCAPGVEIYSTMPGGGYDYLSGTSMACPFAAGAAALILSQNPGMSPEVIKTQLEETAVDLGSAGFDSIFGYGRVNLAEAVGAVTPNKYGAIDVLVTDKNGIPISGASVILWQGETVISTTNSNEDGHAIFEYVLAGNYGVSVSASCFDSCLAENNPVTVTAGVPTSITVAFATAFEFKTPISEVSAYAITYQAGSTGLSVSLNEFQDKLAQLQEKDILKPNYIFNEGSIKSIQKSITPTYMVEIDWKCYPDATGYRVYRKINGGEYALILDWEESSEPDCDNWYGFWDNNVSEVNTYTYYVIAYGYCWETEQSETVTIDTWLPSCSLISPTDESNITDSTPTFTWNPVNVSSFPYGSICSGRSDLWVYDDTGEETVWWTWFNDMTTSLATYNQDGQASPLVSGHDYSWDSWAYGYDENWNLIAMSWSEDWLFTYSP